MTTRKYDALHDLLNAVVMGIGEHKPNEFHIINIKMGRLLPPVLGGVGPDQQTVLPVLGTDERYETVTWHMGGGSTSYDYVPRAHFMLAANLRDGGLTISAGGSEGMYQSPYGLIGVASVVKRAAYERGNVITTPTLGMAVGVIRGMVVEAHRRHADVIGVNV
jgi:hypothetical protein